MPPTIVKKNGKLVGYICRGENSFEHQGNCLCAVGLDIEIPCGFRTDDKIYRSDKVEAHYCQAKNSE